jgi:hypothetical protein
LSGDCVAKDLVSAGGDDQIELLRRQLDASAGFDFAREAAVELR